MFSKRGNSRATSSICRTCRGSSFRNFALLAAAILVMSGFARADSVTVADPVEAAPPTYHKIGLNGRPFGDQLPQDIERTDQEEEQTYIDALSLRLQHCTTDIYVPLVENLPELMVRRNAQGSVWNQAGGLKPNARPDLPFGNCWSTGLGASVHRSAGDSSKPACVDVTDEQGTEHHFFEVAGDGKAVHFCPLPTSTNEQESSALSLEQDQNGDFIFRRKFGTTLLFKAQPEIKIEVPPVEQGGAAQKHSYFRLATIGDRAGGRNIKYVFYSDNHSLIPDEIAFGTQIIHVERNADMQIARLVDPCGGDILYEYRPSKLAGGAPLLVCIRQQEIGGTRAATRYEYDETVEPPAGNGQSAFAHCDIARISDPRDKTYTFEYEFDHSTGTSGRLRCIRKVTIPDNAGTSEFFNLSKREADESRSRRMTFVRDTAGNGRLYKFLGTHLVELSSAAPGTAAALKAPRCALFKSMEIQNFQGSDFRPSGPQGFIPGPKTRLLATESCEFDESAGMALVKAVDLSGNVTRFVYGDEISRPAWMPVNPLAQRHRDPTECINALGGSRKYQYEPVTRLVTRMEDENGRITIFDIEQPGLEKAIRTYADERTLKEGHPFAVTELEHGNPQFPTFKTRETARKIPSPESPKWETDLVTQYEPNLNGLPEREIKNPGGLNDTYRYLYDLNNNKLVKIYPDGYVILFTYDARNRLQRVDRPQDSNAAPKELFYDLRGNKIREVEPNGDTTVIEYDGASRVLRQIVTKSGQTKALNYAYNDAGSKTEDPAEDGSSTLMKFDGLQRVTEETFSDGSFASLEYGKNCGSDLFDSSSFKATRFTTSEGAIYEYDYDALYRKVRMTKKQGKSQAGAEVQEFKYDAAGNLTQEKDAKGGITYYEYDPFNRLVKTVKPDNSVTRTLYTSTGLKYATVEGTTKKDEREFDAAGFVVEHSH